MKALLLLVVPLLADANPLLLKAARQQENKQGLLTLCDEIREKYYHVGGVNNPVQDCIFSPSGAVFYKVEIYGSWNAHQRYCQHFHQNSNLAKISSTWDSLAVNALMTTEQRRYGGTGSEGSNARKWIGIYDCSLYTSCWIDGTRLQWNSYNRNRHGITHPANRCGYAELSQELEDEEPGVRSLGIHEQWRTTRDCNNRYEGICRYDVPMPVQPEPEETKKTQ